LVDDVLSLVVAEGWVIYFVIKRANSEEDLTGVVIPNVGEVVFAAVMSFAYWKGWASEKLCRGELLT
jgi:hypothetical protein